jgi:hypothetical protein
MSLSANAYLAYLMREGYQPKIDSDGDVLFKFEGGTYYIDVDTSDEMYFRLVYPNFWKIEGSNSYAEAIIAATKATRQTKVTKVYLNEGDRYVSAAFEVYLPRPDDFEKIFRRALRSLKAAAENFAEAL